MHCERSTSGLPPSDLTHTLTTIDISSDPLRSPSPSPHFRPYRDVDHEDDRNNSDTGSKSRIEVASRRSGLQYPLDEPREVDQSTRKRSSWSSGSEDLAFTDDDLAQVYEREVLVTSSPSVFGSGSSVFLSKGEQLPIFLGCFASLFVPFLDTPFVLKLPLLIATLLFHGSGTRDVFLNLGVSRLLTASVNFSRSVRSGTYSIPNPLAPFPLHLWRFLTSCLPSFLRYRIIAVTA